MVLKNDVAKMTPGEPDPLKSFPTEFGWTCNLLLVHRIWQRRRELPDVMKVPKWLILT